MKLRYMIGIFLCLGLLSACTLTQAEPEATATPSETLTSVPFTPTQTLTSTITRTPRPSETPTMTLTQRSTPTPVTFTPTATSPYPVGPQTPLPDGGFVEIATENVAQLKPVFSIVRQEVWQSAASRDGTKLFVATNNGIFVYDRQGQQLAHWPSLILHNQPCASCISVNGDGTRFAITTHREGQWFAQVYNVHDDQASLLLEKPIEAPVRGLINEVRVAISSGGALLAYGAADKDTTVIDMNNSQVLLTDSGGGRFNCFLAR